MATLAKDLKFYHALAAIGAASNTDSDSAYVDTSGFEGVIFITPITDSAATGVATMTAQQCDTSGGTYAALSGAVATATCAVNDDLNSHLLIVDVFRPAERYVNVNLVSATANIAYGETVAFAYGAHNAPITQLTAEVSALTAVATPAES